MVGSIYQWRGWPLHLPFGGVEESRRGAEVWFEKAGFSDRVWEIEHAVVEASLKLLSNKMRLRWQPHASKCTFNAFCDCITNINETLQ